ncbi:MAG: hypothetical protein KDK36_00200 [Leptospiraceae bacterium]|nr:hypothetical protein [Leptospiraceae bacterium]
MKKILVLLLISAFFLAPTKTKKKKYVPKNPEYLIGEWEVFQVRELTCNCNDEITPEKVFGFNVKFPGTLLGRKLNIGNETSVFHLEKVQNINKMFTDFKCAYYSKEPEEVRIGKGKYPTIGKFIDRLNKGDYPNTEGISNDYVYGRKFREIVKIGQPFKIFDMVQSPDGKGEMCDSPHQTVAVFRKTVMVTVVGNAIIFLKRLKEHEIGIRKKALEAPFSNNKDSEPEEEDDGKSGKDAGAKSSSIIKKNPTKIKKINAPDLDGEKKEDSNKKDKKNEKEAEFDDSEEDDDDDDDF